MGKKHKKTTAAADAVAAAQVAETAKPAPVAVAAPVPKQNANALADMFAQSSVLFAKKTSYVQDDTALKKQSHQAEQVKMAAEAAELAAGVVAAGGGKRKRSKKSSETVEDDDEQDDDEKTEKKQKKKSSKTDEDEEDATTAGDDSVKPEKKHKKKKHKKLAKEAAEAAAAAAAAAGDSATDVATAEPTEETKSTTMDEEKSQRTVFVGNVSLDATQKDIKTFFSTCGKVESVRLRFMPLAGCAVDQAGNQKLMMKVCANKKILNDSKDNCNAYVTFAEQASVAKALALNGATFMLMKIRVDHENPVVDPKRSVFVGNVGFNVSDEKVRKFFAKRLKSDEEPNPVENVRIVRDRASGVGKGFGYVLLKNAMLAGKALSLHETNLDSRPIRVQVCGKRFKNKKGENDDKSKHEGTRASAGAKARVALKRKASGKPLPEQTQPKKFASPATGSSMKPKPKHVERKAFQAKDAGGKKDVAGDAKRVFKKAPGASGKDGKKFGGKKSSGERTPKPKVKKPKHAARKARQAAEAAAAADK